MCLQKLMGNIWMYFSGKVVYQFSICFQAHQQCLVFFLSNIVVVHTSCLVSYHQSHTVFIILCAFASTLYIITSSICLFSLASSNADLHVFSFFQQKIREGIDLAMVIKQHWKSRKQHTHKGVEQQETDLCKN